MDGDSIEQDKPREEILGMCAHKQSNNMSPFSHSRPSAETEGGALRREHANRVRWVRIMVCFAISIQLHL